MIRLIRILGFLMIGAGAIFVLTWAITPLRAVWPWIIGLPLPLKLGIGAATAGLVVLLGSLLWERFESRGRDRQLRDDL